MLSVSMLIVPKFIFPLLFEYAGSSLFFFLRFSLRIFYGILVALKFLINSLCPPSLLSCVGLKYLYGLKFLGASTSDLDLKGTKILT